MPATTASSGAARRLAPLLVSADEALLDELLRFTAAAGTPPDVARDVEAALSRWGAASVVLVGDDLAAQVAERRPARRDHVHLVGRAPLSGELFRCAPATGATEVVELPAAAAWLVELLSDAADAVDTAGGPARTVAVVAGSGGAGATTMACGLALTAAARERTVLVDLDPGGPGVDLVVGLEARDGVRWSGLVDSPGRLGSRAVRDALPREDRLAVLTFGPGAPSPLPVDAAREVLSACRRGHRLMVLDLARCIDAVAAEWLTRCDLVCLVAETSVAGVAAAGRVAEALRRHTDRVGLVARTGRGHGPPDEVARALDVPLLVEVAHQRRLAEEVELGLGPVHRRRSPVARACRLLLRDLRPADREAS